MSSQSEGVEMALGNATEQEAGGEENAPDGAVDRALSDAANRADPVPETVVDAAKKAYDDRPADTAIDRTLCDAANRADPVPETVVDAAKKAYEHRLLAEASSARTKTSATT